MSRWVSIATVLMVLSGVCCLGAAAQSVKQMPPQTAPPGGPQTAPPVAPQTAPPQAAPPGGPQSSGYYGSIALDPTNCGWGTSWRYSSQSDADNKALEECSQQNSPHCQVIVQMGPNLCGSIAIASTNCALYGSATRGDTAAARQAAVQQCQGNNPNASCQTLASACSSGGN